MSNGYVNQHYVPQFYLRGFKNKTKNDYIWVFDKESKVLEGKIEQVCQKENYYDSDKWFIDEKMVEKGVNPIYEQSLSKPYHNLLKSFRDTSKMKGTIKLTEENKELLATYIFFQTVRTETGRQLLQNIYPIAKYDPIFFQGKVLLEGTRADSLLLSVFRTDLKSKKWVVFYNTTEVPFVTSETPVINLFDAKKDKVLYLPLNKHLLLAIFEKLPENSIEDERNFLN